MNSSPAPQPTQIFNSAKTKPLVDEDLDGIVSIGTRAYYHRAPFGYIEGLFTDPMKRERYRTFISATLGEGVISNDRLVTGTTKHFVLASLFYYSFIRVAHSDAYLQHSGNSAYITDLVREVLAHTVFCLENGITLPLRRDEGMTYNLTIGVCQLVNDDVFRQAAIGLDGSIFSSIDNVNGRLELKIERERSIFNGLTIIDATYFIQALQLSSDDVCYQDFTHQGDTLVPASPGGFPPTYHPLDAVDIVASRTPVILQTSQGPLTFEGVIIVEQTMRDIAPFTMDETRSPNYGGAKAYAFGVRLSATCPLRQKLIQAEYAISFGIPASGGGRRARDYVSVTAVEGSPDRAYFDYTIVIGEAGNILSRSAVAVIDRLRSYGNQRIASANEDPMLAYGIGNKFPLNINQIMLRLQSVIGKQVSVVQKQQGQLSMDGITASLWFLYMVLADHLTLMNPVLFSSQVLDDYSHYTRRGTLLAINLRIYNHVTNTIAKAGPNSYIGRSNQKWLCEYIPKLYALHGEMID